MSTPSYVFLFPKCSEYLPGPAHNNVLRVLKISSNSVHFRRSYSRTHEYRFLPHRVGLIPIAPYTQHFKCADFVRPKILRERGTVAAARAPFCSGLSVVWSRSQCWRGNWIKRKSILAVSLSHHLASDATITAQQRYISIYCPSCPQCSVLVGSQRRPATSKVAFSLTRSNAVKRGRPSEFFEVIPFPLL